jgi:O-antigen/teichoic acid export membrane protein
VALLCVLPLLAGTGGGPGLLVAASVAGNVVACATAVVLLMREGIRMRVRWHPALAAESFRLGAKAHIGRIANMLTWRLDVMILSVLAPVQVVGFYAVASKVAELFRPLSASLTFVLRPVIAGLPIAAARLQGVLLYRRLFAVNLAAIVVMAIVGGPLIVRVFGPEFAAAVPAFHVLLVGLALQGADGVLSGYNVGIGRPELNTYTALAGLVVSIAGDVTLIPAYGIIGAAVASSAAYTVRAAALTAIFLASSGITLGQLAGVREYSIDPA